MVLILILNDTGNLSFSLWEWDVLPVFMGESYRDPNRNASFSGVDDLHPSAQAKVSKKKIQALF